VSAPAPLVWSNVTPEDFDTLKTEAAKDGLELSGVSGDIKNSGVEATFVYNSTAQTLSIQLVHKPFVVGWGYVSTKLTKTINAALGR